MQYFNYLTESSFQRVNRLFVLCFEHEADKRGHAGCHLPIVQIKDYNVMIEVRNVFDQSIKNNLKAYENIFKIAFGQEDDFTADCLLDYSYFKENSKLTVLDFSKQEALDADLKSIQQINFTGDLDRAGNMFFILKEVKEIILNLLHKTVRVL